MIDIDAYVAAHNASRSGNWYSVWTGRGRDRQLVASCSDKGKARDLAHSHAPAQVWALDGGAPSLVTAKRKTKAGEAYTVETRGPWALEQLQADIELMRKAKAGAPPIPLRRARRAVAAMERGSFQLGGKAYAVKGSQVRISRAGLVVRPEKPAKFGGDR